MSEKKLKSKYDSKQLYHLKTQNRGWFESVINDVMTMNMVELSKRLKDKRTSAGELVIIQAFIKGIKTGDMEKVNKVLAWTFGKPAESIEISGPNGQPIQYEDATMDSKLREMEDDELLKTLGKIKKIKKQLKKELEDTQDE